jgi:Ca2+-binding EF-hand superfamily protein
MGGTWNLDYSRICHDARSSEKEDFSAKPIPKPKRQVEVPKDLAPAVHMFLKRFKKHCQKKSMDAEAVFSQYDLHGSGNIPILKVQIGFKACDFPVMKQELEAVTRAFQEGKKNESFNHLSFAKAVAEEPDTDDDAFTAPAVKASTRSGGDVEDVKSVLALIREKVAASGARIEHGFKSVTAETISAKQLQECLTRFQVTLRSGQVKAIVAKYGLHGGEQVDWKTFCEDVKRSGGGL